MNEMDQIPEDDDENDVKISTGPQAKKRKVNNDRSSQRSASRQKSAKGTPRKVSENDNPNTSSQMANGKRVQAPDLETKFKNAVQDGSINKFTVAQIREFLALKSLPDKGVKSFLITIVKEYFDN